MPQPDPRDDYGMRGSVSPQPDPRDDFGMRGSVSPQPDPRDDFGMRGSVSPQPDPRDDYGMRGSVMPIPELRCDYGMRGSTSPMPEPLYSYGMRASTSPSPEPLDSRMRVSTSPSPEPLDSYGMRGSTSPSPEPNYQATVLPSKEASGSSSKAGGMFLINGSHMNLTLAGAAWIWGEQLPSPGNSVQAAQSIEESRSDRQLVCQTIRVIVIDDHHFSRAILTPVGRCSAERRVYLKKYITSCLKSTNGRSG